MSAWVFVANPVQAIAAFIASWRALVLPVDAPAAVTDESLMMAYRDGDAAAFDALYGRHRLAIFRYMRRQIKDDGLAEELFQDVWMRVIGHRQNYEPRAKFTTWLYTIAHNRLMDHFRSAGRAEHVDIDDTDDDGETPVIQLVADPTNAPETMLTRRQLADRILIAFEKLPAEQREAFVLQYEGELSVEEIATVTGVTRETAKSRLRYALAKLRRDLQDGGGA